MLLWRRVFSRLVLALLVAAAIGVSAPRQRHRRRSPQMTAISIREGVLPIVLDGDLNEAAWARPNRSPPSCSANRRRRARDDRTEARVAFDATAMYVAVRAFDPEPDRIVGFLTRRDDESSSDWVRVLIDSYHDRRTAYEFGVNPAGVKLDIYWFNDNNDEQLGRGLGRRGRPRRRTAGTRSSASRIRSCASAAAATAGSDSPSCATSRA